MVWGPLGKLYAASYGNLVSVADKETQVPSSQGEVVALVIADSLRADADELIVQLRSKIEQMHILESVNEGIGCRSSCDLNSGTGVDDGSISQVRIHFGSSAYLCVLPRAVPHGAH